MPAISYRWLVVHCYGADCELAAHIVELPDTTDNQREEFLSCNRGMVGKNTGFRIMRPESWIVTPDEKKRKEKVTPINKPKKWGMIIHTL